ncbi:MAG TPA: calcium/sodium antiporter [Rhodospirillales bacterium]|jgi:cation:H+ antiporter|nr:calcium/sodium antiporter [Rhodospirillales bacterium]HJO69269.1 calcium/sodium antiporter [Rhodospirillales bacterium]
MMYLQLIAGFVFLLGGAELLVRGSVAAAKLLGISPLVIGMTIIALGTSLPEFVVSANAALSGAPSMAVGNVVGSNIANVLLILGASAAIVPVALTGKVFVYEGVAMIAGSVAFAAIALTGVIEFWSGFGLFAAFLAFLVHSYWRELRGRDAAAIHTAEVDALTGLPSTLPHAAMVLVLGIAGVLFGADVLVTGGTAAARTFGVAEEVIGLTVIAIGTSLPELAASAVAAYRGHAEVALGNILGSNLFNLMFVAGAVAMITPLAVPDQIIRFDLWVMLASTILLVPFLVGRRLGRGAAFAFLIAYVAYIAAQAYGVASILPQAS